MPHSRCKRHVTCGWNGLCNDIPCWSFKSCRNQLMESFLLEVSAWNSCFVVYNENYVGLQVLEHVRLNLFNHLIGFIPCQICLYFNI